MHKHSLDIVQALLNQLDLYQLFKCVQLLFKTGKFDIHVALYGRTLRSFIIVFNILVLLENYLSGVSNDGSDVGLDRFNWCRRVLLYPFLLFFFLIIFCCRI